MTNLTNLEKRVNQIIDKYHYISDYIQKNEYSDAFVELLREQSSIEEVFQEGLRYKSIIRAIHEAEIELLNESNDPEMRSMIEMELYDSRSKLEKSKDILQILLLPKDSDDDKNVILEIRAGTGGEEAALFAAVLFNIYRRYSEKHGWKVNVISASETGLNGYREIIVVIEGTGVFAKLKFESGVHRVQRVPETEASGRVHTSAASVVVLAEVDDVDVDMKESDLRIDVYRASGSGGQHVNTTDSAVRVTHIPTGEVVCIQDEKSQHKNKAKALKIMRSRLYSLKKQEQADKVASIKKDQIKSGDRSDRIRTYNYSQNRVTDHRINLTLYALDRVIGEGDIDELITALTVDDQIKKITSETE